jgi:competence protein ComGC
MERNAVFDGCSECGQATYSRPSHWRPTDQRRCAGLSLLETLFSLGVLTILIGLLLPAVQKVREAANRAGAEESVRLLSSAVGRFLAMRGELPVSTRDLAGLVDAALVAGEDGGYRFSITESSPRLLRILARPAAPGVTGGEDVTIEGQVVTGVWRPGQVAITPTPGAGDGRAQLFSDLRERGELAVAELLAAEPTGEAAAQMDAYLNDPANIQQAFADLDGDGDGRVSLAEIFRAELTTREILGKFLNDVRFELLQLGLAGEELASLPGVPLSPPVLVRADANTDGTIDISDGVYVLGLLFLDLDTPPDCLDATDADDNGCVEITDAVIIFSWLFLGGRSPRAPAPSGPSYLPRDCGPDPTGDLLECFEFAPCAG